MNLLLLAAILLNVTLFVFAVRYSDVILLLIASVVAVLQTGQAAWMATLFAEGEEFVQILDEHPTYANGFTEALCLFVLWLLIVNVSVYLFARGDRNAPQPRQTLKVVPCRFSLGQLAYLGYLVAVVAWLTAAVGGIGSFFTLERPTTAPGATMPLILLLAGNSYLVTKILTQKVVTFLDIALALAVALVFTVSGTRLLVVQHLSVLALATFSVSRMKVRFSTVLGVAVLGFTVLIVGQAYKYTTSEYGHEYSESMLTAINFAMEVFYRVMTEAFAGFSGVVQYNRDGLLQPDLGAAFMSDVSRLVPFFLKNVVSSFTTSLELVRSYNFSIIPPGLQEFFCSFTHAGVVLHAAIVSFFVILWKRVRTHAARGEATMSKAVYLWFAISSIASVIHIVRGPTGNAILFGVIPGALGLAAYLFLFTCAKAARVQQGARLAALRSPGEPAPLEGVCR